METMLGVVIALLTLCCGCFRAGYVLGKDIGSKADKKVQKNRRLLQSWLLFLSK